MNLSEAFAMVEVTPSQAIEVLNKLAEGSSDRDPTLTEAFNKAIAELSSPPTEPASDTSSTTSSRTTAKS